MICVGVRRAECAVVWAFQRMAAYARFLLRIRKLSEGPELPMAHFAARALLKRRSLIRKPPKSAKSAVWELVLGAANGCNTLGIGANTVLATQKAGF